MPLGTNTALEGLAPSEIRRFSALARKVPGCVDLTLGEPAECTAGPVCDQVARSLDAGQTHYPPNRGREGLREAICAHMASGGLSFLPEQVVVTNGATEALFSTLFALLEPGDELIVPTPAFLLYGAVATLCRARVVALDTAPDSFQIDPQRLMALVGPRTKAIVVTSPNNPTGAVLDARSLDAVATAAGRGLYVICDDVYDQLVYADGVQGFALRHPELSDRTVVVNSMSKPYAMTGWRLGWLAGPRELVDRIAMVHQYAVSSVVSFTQDAAALALSTDVAPMRAAYRARRDLVLERLDGMGLPVVRPEGAFYAFPRIEELGLGSRDFCVRAAREAGVALVPGAAFGAEGHVRLSYACADDALVRGLDRLGDFVGALRP